MSEQRELSIDDLRRKADQHWEMAGLARTDNDMRDAEIHTNKARKYERMLREARGN